MSYTATFDASHKVKASGAHSTNFVRHIARDVDRAAGFSFVQRNPNIVPARTSMNITMINDGDGGWRAPVVTQDAEGRDRPPSAEISDYLDTRLGTVTRKLRTDAVVMRPLILQLDPEWFAEHNPDWQDHGLNAEAEKYIGAQLHWAEAEFGQENLPGYSVHIDETSPQLQLLFTPVTEDRRLSQKDFFKGPRDLNRQHDEYRHALADAGYEVEFKVTARSKEHLSSEEYAKKTDEVSDRAVRVRVRESNVRAAERMVNAQEEALDGRESCLDEREADLPRRRQKAENEGRAAGLEAGRQEAFAAGYADGREEGEESVRSDLIALDLIPEGDTTPLLPRRRAPKAPTRELTPARERHLSATRQQAR